MTISEQDRQKARSVDLGQCFCKRKGITCKRHAAIAAAIATERERADRYRAALRITPQYSSDAACTWCGAEERVVYADRVYQEGEPHKSDCPRVLMPEVWEEKA